MDSGATGNFIDRATAKQFQIPLLTRVATEDIRTIDGSPIKSGPLTHSTDFLTIVIQELHSETIQFDVIQAPQFQLILGIPWLEKHNPQIDWVTRTLIFPSEYCSSSCLSKVKGPHSVGKIAMVDTRVEGCLPTQYEDLADVFDKTKATTLPPHRPYDCQIDLVPGDKIPCSRIYALTEKENIHLRTYIDEMLKIGFIRHSKSPASSPLFFVPKKEGDLRTCIDYRALNDVTIKNRYPLPLIQTLLDQVQTATIFTKLDLRGAYHLIRVREGDEWKTAFRTKFGLFEYLVMPFGLCNAPAAFQFFINEVLHDFLDKCAVAYIDDILIYSTSLTQHIQQVRAILQRLKENGLFAKLEKCVFHKPSVPFLGYVISAHGLSMDPAKVQAILQWKSPNSVKEIQSFLGFANFYRRFIEHFSSIVTPITTLTRKGVPFVWTAEAEKAFQMLKQAFVQAPILQNPNPQLPFVVETDASQIAVGGILSQADVTSGSLHPVAFYSHKLNQAESNYSVGDKELLAIKLAFKEWRQYLLGAAHQVTVLTDHRNLKYLQSAKALSMRQLRWAQFFSEFDFVIQFQPGRKHGKADALSRLGFVNDTVISEPPPIIPAKHIIGALITEQTFLHEVRTAQATTEALQLSQEQKGQLQDGLVYIHDKLYLPTSSLQKQAIEWCHAGILAGHPGEKRTIDLVKRYFWWPTLQIDIKHFIQQCSTCAQGKSSHQVPAGLLQPMPTPPTPWHTVSMDFIVELPKTKSGNTTVLVVVDMLTKMAHFHPFKGLPTSKKLAFTFLSLIVRQHGLPSVIVTDRGSQFVSNFWKGLGSALQIDLRPSTSHHPQTDGQTERVNQALEQYLRCQLMCNATDWDDYLWAAEFAYNNTMNSSTAVTPFYFNYGYHPRFLLFNRNISTPTPAVDEFCKTLLDLQSTARMHLVQAKETYKRYADTHRRPAPPYAVGDQVWLSTRNITIKGPQTFKPRFVGPYRIIKVINDVAMKLQLPSSLRIHPVFHVSLLKPLVPGTVLPPKPAAVSPVADQEYEVAAILDSKRTRHRLYYLIHWKGYGPEDRTWEPASQVTAPRLVRLFHQRYPDKPKPVGGALGGVYCHAPPPSDVGCLSL